MGDASAKPVNLDNEKTGKNEIARKDDTLDADEVIGEFKISQTMRDILSRAK